MKEQGTGFISVSPQVGMRHWICLLKLYLCSPHQFPERLIGSTGQIKLRLHMLNLPYTALF